MRSLIYFFEFQYSLLQANTDGLLDRNLALHINLLERGDCDQVLLFSFNPDDLEFLQQCQAQGRLPKNIQVLKAPAFATKRFGAVIYSLIGPFIHRTQFRRALALHTHQVSCAWTALLGKLIFRTPLLFRCGYPLSIRFRQEAKPVNYYVARLLEKMLMLAADHVGVTSRPMQDYYREMNRSAEITLMPNYVDLGAYSPKKTYDTTQPILFVGRLVEVKNIDNIILACAQLGLALHIYGKGPLEAHLREQAKKCGADVSFMGVVSNTDLAKVHHRHSIFLTCSTREGLPKAVVEAMASGLVIVGTKTDGVLELIEDGVTGHHIDGFDAHAIADKLEWVLRNFSPDIGRAAARFAKEHYSLEFATSVTSDILQRIGRPA